MTMPPFHKILTTTALCLAAMGLSSCLSLNLTEQLEPEDKRFPTVYHKEERECSIWLHKGNYYTRMPVCYAARQYPVWSHLGGGFDYVYDSNETWDYYFPLTDDEATWALQSRDEDTPIHQPRNAKELAPLRVSEQPKVGWSRIKETWCSNMLPESVARIPLPVRDGKRSLAGTLFYPPVWVAEVAGNTVLYAVQAPVVIPLGLFIYLITPEHVAREILF